MRWREGRRSRNIEDRRGLRGRPGMAVGGLGGGGLLILVIVALLLGVDPIALLQQVPVENAPVSYDVDRRAPAGAGDELAAEFVSAVLASTEDTWGMLFQQMGRRYNEPKLVLFESYVRSACGLAQSAVGPFYCPGDQQVYLDLSFFSDLQRRFAAPGDFAQAYVISHEVGHHVQTLLGVTEEFDRVRRRVSEVEANALSVRFELQADCFAGVWAHHADRMRNILEDGDLEEALNAASQIGDDRIQMRSQGYVAPDSFTHGSSEQRSYWFRQGYQTGIVEGCDTFSIRQP